MCQNITVMNLNLIFIRSSRNLKNYLEGQALEIVKEINVIEEIWERVKTSFGNDEPRSGITANLQEVPIAGRHRPAARPAGAWGGWGPRVSPRYSENFDTRSWAWNTSGGELYVALEGVAPQPPEGRDHAEEKPMAPAADAPPRRKEWVCRSQEEWNAAWRMGPKRARVKYDPARKANTGRRRWGVCQATGVTR